MPEKLRESRRRSRLGVSAARALLLVAIVVLPLNGCGRKSPPKATENATEKNKETPSPHATPLMRRIMAAWYRVPEHSLAKRRAAPDEYTAAHNSLPLGTRVRVTNPENNRSVIVRITDRGIHDRRVKLDLCKEAATELGVIEKGIAHLRMQVLPKEGEGTPGDSEAVYAAE